MEWYFILLIVLGSILFLVIVAYIVFLIGMRMAIKGFLSTTPEELEVIKNLEKEEKWNTHTSEGGYTDFIPVNSDFEFIPKNNLKNNLINQFVSKPFVRIANGLLDTEVVGKENLKGLESAVVCCNHVNKMDCCAVMKGLPYNKTYFVAAEFNNLKGFFGDGMREGGMVPLSSNLGGMKKFYETVNKLLSEKNFVVIYPEVAEWWCYKKPRPFLDGGAKIAINNNVPILPVYLTYKDSKASLNSETGLPKFVLHILKPIYPDEALNRKEKIKDLDDKLFASWMDCYNETYQIKA